MLSEVSIDDGQRLMAELQNMPSHRSSVALSAASGWLNESRKKMLTLWGPLQLTSLILSLLMLA